MTTIENSRNIILSSLLILVLVFVPVAQSISPNINILQPQMASATSGIVLNNTATTNTANASPYQITLDSFNVGTGSNRLLVVGVGANNQDVASVKFGGVALTKAVESFRNNAAEFWYLKNPSGTGDIVVTMNGATSAVVGAYAFSGIDQTNPIPTVVENNNTASSSPTISLTTKYANSWVLDLPAIYGGKTLSSPTCTSQWDVTSTSVITSASSSTTTTLPGSITCSWTANPSGDLWDDVAIEVKAAALSTTASTGLMTPVYCDPYGNDGSPCGGCTGTSFCWQAVADAKTNHTRVPVYDIVNPNSGFKISHPANCTDPGGINVTEYKKGTDALANEGVIVLGYVDTNYTRISQSTVESQIDNYKSCLPSVTGIFFDEMTSDSNTSHESYYSTLTSYAKTTDGMKFTVGNPGNPTIAAYIGTVDNLVIYENQTMPSNLQSDVISGYNKGNFTFVAYDVSSAPSPSTITSDSNYVGFLYVTDNTGCNGRQPPCADLNPYNTTSTYLSALAADLDQ